ncbi:indolepyruvate ferredoxin oxidoreductase family protein [Caenispirillum bisanense]|uniref:Indolepyruvate ferredoxin oxidoreductase n=1 Tax=Caenispirillum bisanense TaxID=414052 RepID=A0A286G664_9PROT|nr:indolepyruvate ferredoxin oxidoreductase family protein [Caenispirillum bisanense]SOD90993.1 indolepyruvate ferredoxin oxidoreductase [Caenispirillum bisanense]
MTFLANVTLDDKYTLASGRIYITGIQALARLPMMQRERDLAAGLNTAGFISGYRGSPIGGLDKELWKAREHLKRHHIHFQPGVNEDLAATAVWGSQQTNLFPGAKYDGVFGMWYGKGPGVDRSGDVLRHANMAGVAKNGGVLLLAGDDHAAKSSTVAYQTEYAFMDFMMPVLAPANVQEIVDYGVLGWAMSRYSGCWVAFKALGEILDSSASIAVDPHRIDVKIPTDFEMPAGGLHIRWPDAVLEQEHRLMKHKLYAALAFARANGLNRVVMDSPTPRLGIVTTGKSYLDVRQALHDLGIDERMAAEIGIRVYKVGMPWPLEREGVREFAQGLEEILVIEEKRALIENQLKEQLYNWREDVRPRVVGKFDENRNWILPSTGELTPARVARVIAERLAQFYTSPAIKQRLEWLEAKERSLETPVSPVKRVPYFCAGCPHNTSTKVPEGSRAVAGIGCHYMVTWMDRSTSTFTHMGGEGVPWIGQMPFTEEKHIFANLGDGTYFHSGILAIRASVAAKANITYKILYNDAVAMTGGQPVDGILTPWQITRQLEAEGVQKIIVVADDPDKYAIGTAWAGGVTIRHRDDLDAVQKELRGVEGVTVLLYDQTCAAEKRRRRKRGKMIDPDKRVFVNELVCEGCGDCGVQSNCVAVQPVETEYGRKRMIDQSSCNKDFSCVKGFCPSFVTIEGAKVRKKTPDGAGKSAAEGDDGFGPLPMPTLPAHDEPYGIVVTGIGGTGVVTIGALLGMAGHLEGKGVSVLDQIGLAQKNGAVVTHVQIAESPSGLYASRIAAGNAKVVIGCDMLTAGTFDVLGKTRADFTTAVVNDHETMTAEFTSKPDIAFPRHEVRHALADAVGADAAHFVDATRVATALMGDSIATNLFMVGYAWQRGLIPLTLESIEKAIELNGVAIKANKAALLWGRRYAVAPGRVETLIDEGDKAPAATELAHRRLSQTFDEVVARRVEFLTGYQNAAYAGRFRALVDRAVQAEKSRAPGRGGFAEAVARSAFKLMAYKDEYEVARLYTDGRFQTALKEQFEGENLKLTFHMAPPLIAKRGEDGHLKKTTFGPWMMGAFRTLAKLKGLRGSALDVFGYSSERKLQRRLIAEYEAVVAELCQGLTHDTHGLAVEIAGLPQKMRGFGHVLERNVAEQKAREAELLNAFRHPQPTATAAE